MVKMNYSQNQNSQINEQLKEKIKQQNKDYSNVVVDENQIRKKLLKDRPTELPIKNYKIQKDGDFYNTKTQKNPTADVFNFSEEFLQKKSYTIQVYGLGNGYFSVNETWYPGSIICFQKQIFLWDVNSASEIRPHSLDLFDVIKPKPCKSKFEVPENVYERFVKQGIKVDILPTFEACSTFNVCAEDGMNIVALLIPANL